jgi:hypothetical protein
MDPLIRDVDACGGEPPPPNLTNMDENPFAAYAAMMHEFGDEEEAKPDPIAHMRRIPVSEPVAEDLFAGYEAMLAEFKDSDHGMCCPYIM